MGRMRMYELGPTQPSKETSRLAAAITGTPDLMRDYVAAVSRGSPDEDIDVLSRALRPCVHPRLQFTSGAALRMPYGQADFLAHRRPASQQPRQRSALSTAIFGAKKRPEKGPTLGVQTLVQKAGLDRFGISTAIPGLLRGDSARIAACGLETDDL